MKKCRDHLGNQYRSITAMARAYNRNPRSVFTRLHHGWTIEQALIADNARNVLSRDHQGNEYSSIKEMCKHWGVSPRAFARRLEMGLTMEEALTSPLLSSIRAVDHIGNTYKSQRDMCKHYNISTATYLGRLDKGWTIGQALTIPPSSARKAKACKDHLGNEYDSMSQMCEHYGIAPQQYTTRMKHGWTLERALTIPTRGRR